MIQKCRNCNKEFELTKVQEKNFKKNGYCYCSKKCAALYNNKDKNPTKWLKQDKKTGQFIKKELKTTYYNCTNCNKKFKLTQIQQNRLKKEDNPNLFCCKSCSAQFSNSHRSDKWLEDRKETNLRRYNDEYYVNKEQISKTIKKLYEEQNDYGFSSDAYKEKMKEKYGVENISQLVERQKQISLNQISKETYNILHSKDNFENFIKSFSWAERNVKYISSVLDIDITTFYLYYKKYNCQIRMNNYKSGYEIYLYYLIKSLGFEVEQNNRKIIAPKELDLYIPEKKLAIEFNGTYYHNSSNMYKDSHKKEQLKSKLCADQGIFLFHIYEWEWLQDKDQVINQLKNLLGLSKKIHVAKCYIKEIDSTTCQKFLKENHKQGKTYTTYRIGLFLNRDIKGLKKDTLVAVMCFSKSSRNKNYEYELIRFCCLQNYSIIQGASTLFNYFLTAYNPSSIISYSDIGSTKGTLYNILGFRYDKDIKGSYIWTNNKVVYNRESCMKSKLTKLLGDKTINLEKTEKQIMEEHGFLKVDNLGRRRHIWRRDEN